MKAHFIYLPAFLFSVVFLCCKDTVTNSDIDNIIIPSSNVSYSKYIQPLFNIKCNYSGCHSEGNSNGLILTSCQEAKADLSIVFPGSPETSRLVQLIEGNSPNPMPPVGYPPLTKNQIDGIITWIKEGANCN